MRAARRLVVSALVAGVVVLAWTRLGGEATRAREGGATALARRQDGRAAAGAACTVLERSASGPSPVTPVGVTTGAAAAQRTAANRVPGDHTAELATPARGALPFGGGDPGPRVALEPLVPEPGRVTAPLRGEDPGGPRLLLLWRLEDGRAARAADGESHADGRLDFPEVPLAGRGELFVTGAGVSADLAARLPSDRIPVPAAIAAGRDPTVRRSLEQEVQ